MKIKIHTPSRSEDLGASPPREKPPIKNQKLAKKMVKKAVGRKIRHGHGHGTSEYYSWKHMKRRVLDEKNPCYKDYGGRGITICSEWLKFDNFLADMGPKPSKGHSIERENNNLGYCKSNCKWASAKEQANNKRNNRRVTINGQTKTLAQWAESIGIGKSTLHHRIGKLGWSLEDAISKPIGKTKPTR